MKNKNPHFAAICRCTRQIHETRAWDAPDDEAEPLYAQSEFHWNHLSDNEKKSNWEFSILLSIAEASGKKNEIKYPPNEGFEKYQGENFVAYCKLWYKLHEVIAKGEPDEGSSPGDALRDQMDDLWYSLNEEEKGIIGRFGSMLSLSDKKGEVQ